MSDEELEGRLKDLEQKVEKVEGEVKQVQNDVSWLRKLYDDVVDRLRSAAGHLTGTGKGSGGKKDG